MFKWSKYFKFKKSQKHFLDLDEVFLDSENLSSFDTGQFEDTLERPITKKAIFGIMATFVLISVIFAGRIGFIQVVEGGDFADRSNNNRLRYTHVFADRGIIYDRNNKPLAWNEPERQYIADEGFAHVLGYIGYPNQIELESSEFDPKEYIGKNGVENTFNDILMGQRGIKIEEISATGVIESDHILQTSEPGDSIKLSIDARLQKELFSILKQVATEAGYTGGAVAIMDVESGEVISLVSFPEYDSNILASGDDRSAITKFLTDESKPFLNRVVSGLYTPGSIVKPFVGLAALNENLINPNKIITTRGVLEVPNPYYPDKPSIYRDWKNLGPVNMRQALALSSNIYFIHVGGGFGSQPGLGISKINEYTHLFGLGQKTGIELNAEAQGVIPNPEWKAKTFDGEPWRLGDTYLTSIGQYGYLITPLQMLRSIGMIANGGKLVDPTLIADRKEPKVERVIDISPEDFAVIRGGMRDVVTSGTGAVLNMKNLAVAAKSGTAEIDASKRYINSWITGFFPYEKPKYSFVVVLEQGPYGAGSGGGVVMRRFFDWLAVNAPEYIDPNFVAPKVSSLD